MKRKIFYKVISLMLIISIAAEILPLGSIQALAAPLPEGQIKVSIVVDTDAGLDSPRSVAMDGSNLYIYNVDMDSGTPSLNKLTGSTMTEMTFDGPVAPNGGLALDSGDRLYVTSGETRSICIVDTAHIEDLPVIVSTDTYFPRDVAADSTGTQIYFTDMINGSICKIDTSDSNSITLLDTQGILLSQPNGLALDSSDSLYIADTGNNVIRKMDADGNISIAAGNGTPDYTSDGAALATGLSIPSDIAVDAAGNLFIADTGNSAIRKVDTLGNITTLVDSGQVSSPEGIAIGKDGNLYIADTGNKRVLMYKLVPDAPPIDPPPPPPIVLPPTPPPVPPPSVTTLVASAAKPTEATLNASIANSNGVACTQVNFYYRIKGTSAWQMTAVQGVSLSDGGQFSDTITGLSLNSTYEYKARAYNIHGWGEGSIQTFSTATALRANVVTKPVINVSTGQATLMGLITDNGGVEVTDSGFIWGVESAGPNGLQQSHVTAGADGSMKLDLNNLEKNTTYIFRAYADNAAGTSYGDIIRFTTPKTPIPTVQTLNATKMDVYSAVLRGRVTGITDKLTEYGFNISYGKGNGWVKADSAPDANGYFSGSVQYLQPGTTYYFSAYAANQSGTGRGDYLEFTTGTYLPEVETRAASYVTASTADISGYITKNKGFHITESGFIWGYDADPVNRVAVPAGQDMRTLKYTLKGLNGGVTYYVKAYATSEKGTGYGPVISFTTPAAKPTITTVTPVFEPLNWEATLNGDILYNGGAPVTEYGFRISQDQKSWNKIIIGTGGYQGAFIFRLNGLDKLPCGTHYIQAYAINSLGTSYGEILNFTTPFRPTVTAAVDKKSISQSSAILSGTITDTGGEGITCTERKFQYRVAGTATWLEAGIEDGVFGTGEFHFKLDDLKPITRYEFSAMAYNLAGYASSPAIVFTTGYGDTDRDVAVNMKAAGFSATDTAKEIKNRFGDTDEAAIQALKYAGFGVVDIATALKSPVYNSSYKTTVARLRAAGYDELAVAEVLQKVYRSEMLNLHGGNLDNGIIIAFNETGYSIDDTLKVIRNQFNYSIPKAADRLYLGASGPYSYSMIYGSIARVYGLKELASLIWNKEPYWYDITYKLGDVAIVLKNDCGATPEELADTLGAIYPSMNISNLSKAFKWAEYSTAETGNQLSRFFKADLPTTVDILVKTNFNQESIEAWMIRDMNCTALEAVTLMTSLWTDPRSSIPRALTTYYSMGASDAAKLLYQAGWTENKKPNTYWLNDLVRIMINYYGKRSPEEIIKILKEIGLSPLAVANCMDGLSSYDFGGNGSKRIDWLTPYRDQGYTATDAFTWRKTKSSGAGSAIGYLDKHYSLNDLVTGVRNVYGIDAGKALETFRFINNQDSMGWKESDIVKAINDIYGVDPIPAALQQMKRAHYGATTSAGTLKDTFKMDDPEKVAIYLVQTGYEESEVLKALDYAFYANSRSADTIQKLTQIAQKVYNQKSEESIGPILRALGCERPESAVYMLKEAGYTILNIALALKNGYSQDINQVTDVLMMSGRSFKEQDIIIGVMAAFGMDPVLSYIQVRKGAGDTLGQITNYLRYNFQISDPEKFASYLAQAGYKQSDVLEILLNTFYPGGSINSESMQMLSQILKKVYQSTSDSIRPILEAAGIKAPEEAIRVLQSAGYTFGEIVRVLKDIYNVPAGQATDLLNKSGLFRKELVTAEIQAIYGGDFVLAYMQYFKSRGGNAASGLYKIINELGITDTVKAVRYMLDAGYTENDLFAAVRRQAWDDTVLVIKNCFGITDPDEIAKYFKDRFSSSSGLYELVRQLPKAFPDITAYGIALALSHAGYPVYGNGASISGWLRSYEEKGKRDDQLAAILGTANPGDLDLETIDAAEILQGKGYTIEEVAAWLKKDNYSLGDIFSAMNYRYNSMANNKTQVMSVLKETGYTIEEIAEADYYSIVGFSCGWVYNDLMALNCSKEEAIRILMKIGAKVPEMVAIMYDRSIDIANKARNQGLRLTATQIAVILYTISQKVPERNISLSDIAKGIGDKAMGPFAYWDRSGAVDAVLAINNAAVSSAIQEISKAGINVGGMMTEGSAYGILKEAGWSSSDSVLAMASRGTGLNEAFVTMLIAGYSFSDTVSAIMSNTSYKIAISGQIALSVMTAGLSFSFQISETWIVNAAANAAINSAVKKAATTAIIELVKSSN